ncbi:hypothetical protein B9G55_01960 [Saccharibacillus sp. O16]|nr:hypothetical protein B9G55_01960 [Saccharibacillus sp. O16]
MEDLKAVSRLIAGQNKRADRHVGYCGIEAAEILHTLEQEFDSMQLERHFTLAVWEEQIVGVLGFDVDLDSSSDSHSGSRPARAEIWGPFVDWETLELQDEDAASDEACGQWIDSLWSTALARAGLESLVLQGFYHEKNVKAGALMQRVGASLTGQHMTLALSREDFQAYLDQADQGGEEASTSDLRIMDLGVEWAEAFVRLHDEVFPGSYASGSALLHERDAEHRLIGCVREGRLLGYAFVSGSREFAEGDIEFLAAAPQARGEGVGLALLQAALRILFEAFEPHEVRLTVSMSNLAAIGLYRKCGFQTREEMKVYEMQFLLDSPGFTLDFLRE